MNKYNLKSKYTKYIATRNIVNQAKYMQKNDRDNFVRNINEKLDINPQDTYIKNKMLTWEDTNIMKDSEITFGSHGMNHLILTKFSLKEAEYEISESKKIIQEKTEKEVKYFCYPNGGFSDFNEDIVKIVKNNKYSVAGTLIRGNNNDDSIYTLKRYCITSGFGPNLFCFFSRRLFDIQISGIWEKFK